MLSLFKKFIYKVYMFLMDRHLSILWLPAKSKNEKEVGFFCSTIGELNSCKTLIDSFPEDGVVILTDRECYLETFSEIYPKSEVFLIDDGFKSFYKVYERFSFKRFIVCEIPCLPNDAPCRLNFMGLSIIRKMSLGLYLVNGWLYGYAPACKQDWIERRFLSKEYVQLFDGIAVQSNEVKNRLIGAGYAVEKVIVSGNMKFDMVSSNVFDNERIKEIFFDLKRNNSQVITAGCISSLEEVEWVVRNFVELKSNVSGCKMVFAPRHPENNGFMEGVFSIFKKFDLDYQLRSDFLKDKDVDVVILNTFGELRACYACSDFSYVGVDHNLLEPIAFSKPVVTLNNWNHTYPSYPVYEILKASNNIFVLDYDDSMYDSFIKPVGLKNTSGVSLEHLMGATKRNLEMIN